MHVRYLGLTLLLLLLLLLAVLARPVAAQTPPTIEATLLADGVYQLTISFGTTQSGPHLVASVGPDGVFLVDNHFSPAIFSTLIENKLAELSGGADLEYIVNTHYHPDHNGGNGYFIGQGVPVIAHENVRTRMADGTTALGLVEPGVLFEMPPRPDGDLPTQTFTEDFELPFNGQTVEISHAPRSHTDGDGVVYFATSKVLAVGDLVWPDEFPYVDILNDGSALGLADAIGDLIARMPEDVQIVSGHGRNLTLADLRAYHDMLLATIETVRGPWEAGQSLSEIQAMGLGAEWASWASDLVPEATWIEYIFESLEASITSNEVDPGWRGQGLLPVTPNPSRGRAMIRYYLTAPSSVELSIHSIRGRRVAVLDAAQRGAGVHAVTWNAVDASGHGVAPGTYVCRLTTQDGAVYSQAFTLVR